MRTATGEYCVTWPYIVAAQQIEVVKATQRRATLRRSGELGAAASVATYREYTVPIAARE